MPFLLQIIMFSNFKTMKRIWNKITKKMYFYRSSYKRSLCRWVYMLYFPLCKHACIHKLNTKENKGNI